MWALAVAIISGASLGSALRSEADCLRSAHGCSPADAARFLAREGKRLGSAELTSLAQQASAPEGLDKVKGLIRHLLADRMDAQAAGTSHKSFCDGEMVKSAQKLVRLKAELEKMNADNDMMKAKFDELKEGIPELHSDVAAMEKANVAASRLRATEHEDYLGKKAAFESASRHELGSPEEEEFFKKQVKMENKESDAAFKFKEMQQNYEVSKTKKNNLRVNKEREVVRRNLEVSQADGDLRNKREQISAAADYNEKIKSQCIARSEPHEERKARREEQMTSLKEAYQMLNGNSIPTYS